MVEWFFFNRVNVDATGIRVDQCEVVSFPIFPGPTKTPLTITNYTLPWAEQAVDILIRQPFIIKCGVGFDQTLFDILCLS